MNSIVLHPDAEIKFQIQVQGCFGSRMTELHLIPSESNFRKLFFQINRSDRSSFVVKVSKSNAEKLLSQLLDFAVAEQIMPEARSTTSIEGKVEWKNISYPSIKNSGSFALSEIAYIKPDEFLEVYSLGKIPDEKLQEIKLCNDKGMFSPVIAISEVFEKISESEEKFMQYVEKL